MSTDKQASKKHKICMIVQQPDVQGGIAAVTNGYYNSILEESFDIVYVESYCDGSFFKKLKKAFKAYIKFGGVLKDFSPELVHIHSSFGGSFYRMQPFIYMAKKRGIPVVDHLHGADFETFFTKASDKKKARIKEVYNCFERIIVLSEEWKKLMSQIVPDEKLIVIANYCKSEPSEKVSQLIDSRYAKKQVLFLGEIGKRKGGYDFPAIVENSIAKNEDISFVFCGSGTEADVRRIKENIYKVATEKNVLFPGWVIGDSKKTLLEESSVFLLPSYNEGLPMSILDAMAYGLPVVATDVGGVSQLVIDGENGFLTAPGDCEGISEGIAFLLSDKEKYISASRKSLSIANSEFSFEVHVSKLGALYKSLLK